MEASNTGQYEIVVFPWLGLAHAERLEWGEHRIVTWEEARRALQDEALRRQLDRVMECYTDRASRIEHNPTLGLGVLTSNLPSLEPYSESQITELQVLRAVLGLGALSHSMWYASSDAGGHHISFTENLEYFIHRVRVGAESISTEGGVLVSHRNIGTALADAVFARPPEIGLTSRVRCDDSMLRGLSIARESAPSEFRRIVAAAELLNASWSNSQIVHISARIMLQAAALEALLDITRLAKREKAKALKDEIERRCATARDALSSLQLPDDDEPEPRTVFGHWTHEMYRLRNALSHNAHLPPSDFTFRGQHHALIGPLVFLQCVMSELAVIAERAGAALRFTHRLQYSSTDEQSQDASSERSGFRMGLDYSALSRIEPDTEPA